MVPLRRPYRAAFLAWLVPGLGHFYQGRTGKGWLYAICILSLYLTGFLFGEGKIVYWRWVNPLQQSREVLPLLPGSILRRIACAARLDPGNNSLPRPRSEPSVLGVHGGAAAECPERASASTQQAG